MERFHRLPASVDVQGLFRVLRGGHLVRRWNDCAVLTYAALERELAGLYQERARGPRAGQPQPRGAVGDGLENRGYPQTGLAGQSPGGGAGSVESLLQVALKAADSPINNK